MEGPQKIEATVLCSSPTSVYIITGESKTADWKRHAPWCSVAKMWKCWDYHQRMITSAGEKWKEMMKTVEDSLRRKAGATSFWGLGREDEEGVSMYIALWAGWRIVKWLMPDGGLQVSWSAGGRDFETAEIEGPVSYLQRLQYLFKLGHDLQMVWFTGEKMQSHSEPNPEVMKLGLGCLKFIETVGQWFGIQLVRGDTVEEGMFWT